MPAHTGYDAAGGENPPPDARDQSAPRPGVVVAVIGAALVSASLAWWLAAQPDRSLTLTPSPSPPPAAPTPPRQFADSAANGDQIRRAYEELQNTYADGGLPAVRHSEEICAGSLSANPKVLDYCLAFSLFADALQPGRDNQAARFAMARDALPAEADPGARLAEVAAMTRSLTAPATASSGERPRVRAKAAAQRPVAAAKRPNQRAASTCRLRSTPTERAICASPALQTADRQMRAAYNRALASGANRRELARDQARWKVAANAASSDRRRLAALYAERTRELRAAARRR